MNSKKTNSNELAVSPFIIFEMPIVQIREAVSANLSDTIGASDFERIKIPTGGGQVWTVQTPDGEKPEKELSGVIVGWHDTRAYWAVPLDQSNGNAPPNCSSVDARTGVGEPGGTCLRCRLSQFGSGQNEAQACKLVRQLFLVRKGNLLPEIVNLPASSVKPARQYFVRLAARGWPFYSIKGNRQRRSRKSFIFS
jgi:hypothetical protein